MHHLDHIVVGGRGRRVLDVAYDTNRYSVPRRFAFQAVTVKGYVDWVVIVSGG
jgi:hypothetical protein